MSEEVIDSPVEAAAAAPVASPAPAPKADAHAAAPAPKAAATAADTTAAPAEPEPIWRPDWREKMAGDLPETATAEEKAEHTKLLGRLKRFNSPSDAAKALREADKLISSGELKRALPKNATEAQLAEFRKANGIPDTPEKYDFGLPKDIELTELDNKMLTGWAAKAHAAHATPDQVKAGVAAFMETRAAIVQQQEEANAAAKASAIEELRAEWGHDYQENMAGLKSMLGSFDSEASTALLSARTGDGVQILNIPAVARALASHARTLGFIGATVVPAGGDLAKTIDEEISSIEATMHDASGKRSAQYWQNPKAQERYAKLLETKARREKQ